MNHLFKMFLLSVQAAIRGLPEIMLFQGLDLFNSVLKHSVTSSVETSHEKELIKIIRWKL